MWHDKSTPLVQRLSRSFHIDETQTLTLTKSATPFMMTELNNLIGNQNTQTFITENFRASIIHLPAWSADFIEHIPSISSTDLHSPTDLQEKTNHVADNSSNDDNPPSINTIPKDTPNTRRHQKKPINPLVFGAAALAIAAIGAGTWFVVSSHKKDPSQTPDTQAIQTTQSLNAPRISITTGENGTLYACQAEIGSQELQTALLEHLQKNFPSVTCITDIDDSFGASLAGLERLDSIIAMLKSEPFTSIEIVGNQIFINNPKSDVLSRMVNDIGLLAPQFQVSVMPALDKATVIAQSIERTNAALNALTSPINPYDLARTMSLQIIDFNGANQLPKINQAVLTLAAEKLKENPDIKLIIATHTDTSSTDHTANVALTQNQAETVRNFLIQQGVADTQLVSKGVGGTLPVADNITELGKFKNRRTEFLIFDENIINALSVAPTMTTPPPPTQIAAPVIPSPLPENPMPVQGMPSGVVAPESSYQQAQPVSQPYNELPPSESYAQDNNYVYEERHTPQVQIPQEVLELSQTTIHSEGTGQSQQLQ